MNKLASLGVGLVFSLTSFTALAQSFDGSRPLICSTIETYDCAPGGDCIKGLAADINAPQFIHLDFEQGIARTVRTDGEQRTVEIKSPLSEAGHLIFQGVQLGRAWSATINQESGTLVLTAADDGVAFIVFGACTPM